VEDVNPTTTLTTAKDDLQLLEKCLSWRQLYVALEQRKVKIQATQGKRMREIRNNVRVHTIPLSLSVLLSSLSLIYFYFYSKLNYIYIHYQILIMFLLTCFYVQFFLCEWNRWK
jgi:hypothetical protein